VHVFSDLGAEEEEDVVGVAGGGAEGEEEDGDSKCVPICILAAVICYRSI